MRKEWFVRDIQDTAKWRDKYRFLVWSNPEASDSVYLRAALLDPHWAILLDAVQSFGIKRLLDEWASIADTPEAQKVAWYTHDLLLRNFALGLQDPAHACR
ncbi:MAG: hypothetical protein ACYDEV_09970 [Acidiferrobacter sp.]